MKDCIFCKIINKDLPSSIIYEDDFLIAFLDIQPANPGHILLIPKKHVESIAELDDKNSAKMIALANKINKAIKKSDLKSDGINYLLADGEAAGQEVFHTHLHLIPRFKNDGLVRAFPEGHTGKNERSVLEEIAKEIREKL